MIDETLLIEKFSSSDGIEFKMNFKTGSKEEIIESLQEFADKLREGVLNLIKSQPKVGEWIPCSERLPEEEHSMYWTTHEDGSVVQHGWSERHGFIYNWELGEKRARMGTVIAWMPIFKPEPYKE